jgi:hypothetical protein
MGLDTRPITNQWFAIHRHSNIIRRSIITIPKQGQRLAWRPTIRRNNPLPVVVVRVDRTDGGDTKHRIDTDTGTIHRQTMANNEFMTVLTNTTESERFCKASMCKNASINPPLETHTTTRTRIGSTVLDVGSKGG